MQKTFRGKVRKIMGYNMLQKKDEDLPGNFGEFESFEDFMEEFQEK